jgi:hypothetical protein
MVHPSEGAWCCLMLSSPVTIIAIVVVVAVLPLLLSLSLLPLSLPLPLLCSALSVVLPVLILGGVGGRHT